MTPRIHGGTDALGPVRWDFSSNANACGPCPAALQAVQRADAAHYPDPAYTRLRAALADLHGVDPVRVLLVASASEGIQRITGWRWRAGDRRFWTPPHAYGDYAHAASAWGLERVNEPGLAPLAWLCDPGSPLGQGEAPDAVRALLDPTPRTVVLDRAYAPLRLRGDSALSDAQLDRVWQLWSPNKALGLTGVRAAYAIAPLGAHADRVELEALSASWPIGAHGEAMLMAWAQPGVQDWVGDSRATLAECAEALRDLLVRHGWTCASSDTAYGCAKPPQALDAAALRAQGIKLRDATSFGLPGWWRLSAQRPEALAALDVALREQTVRVEGDRRDKGIRGTGFAGPQDASPLRGEDAKRRRGGFQGMTAVCVMVLGTTSGAGKSWLTTALCRHYARQGLRVVPFKAQNMSNNARVVARVAGGQGEIGSAQYFQSLAAKAEPDVRMNPLLLKPEADTRSQVVLMGEVSRELSDMPWRGRSEKVWPHITAALDALRAENDVVVIEGAGSPAEINLHASDIVNMRVARHAQARCLLVTDIDRGGAFAHLYGTWALLPEDERALIKGFVLNKFRGDASLLAPAPQMLQDLTGVPVVATLPMWWQHGLPEEDGVFDDKTRAAGAVRKTVAVIAWPRISNLDEFQPLKNVPGVRLVWARTPADCAGADWIILPGSKSTAADLAWLRQQGLDRAVAEHAAWGGAVLGICGGLQVLGEALIDTHGIDGNAPGLGLLPLVTGFDADKTVCRTTATFGALAGAWSALSGVSASGYEIHHGQTAQHPAMAAKGDIAREVIPGLAWQNAAGNVLGCYLHGLFEDPAVLRALFGATVPTLETVFDGLADFLEQHVEPGVLDALIHKD